MSNLAVKIFTEYGMKRIELYPFGIDAMMLHIDVDFVVLERGELTPQDVGKVTYGVHAKQADVEEAEQFYKALQLACEVARRTPMPWWPGVLATDEVYQVMRKDG